MKPANKPTDVTNPQDVAGFMGESIKVQEHLLDETDTLKSTTSHLSGNLTDWASYLRLAARVGSIQTILTWSAGVLVMTLATGGWLLNLAEKEVDNLREASARENSERKLENKKREELKNSILQRIKSLEDKTRLPGGEPY
mgnify:CR=1 FL=1|jgi:hypothetical protein